MKLIVSENHFKKIMGVEDVPADVLIEQVSSMSQEGLLTILQQKINELINDPKREKALLDNINISLNMSKDGMYLKIGEQTVPLKDTGYKGVYGAVLPQGTKISTSAVSLSTMMKEIEKIPEYKQLIEANPTIKDQIANKVVYNQLYSDDIEQGYFEVRINKNLQDRKEEKLAIDVTRPYPLGEFFIRNKVIFKLPDHMGGYFATVSSANLMADVSSITLVPKRVGPQPRQEITAPVTIDFSGLGDVFNFGEVTFKNEEKVQQALQAYIQRMKQMAEKYGTPFIQHVQRQNPTVLGFSSVDGDPSQEIIGTYKPCSGNKTRQDYDMCLSSERAKLISEILNQGLPEFDGAFKYKGMGETTKWGPGWTPENPTMPAETAPNRRYLLSPLKPYVVRSKK